MAITILLTTMLSNLYSEETAKFAPQKFKVVFTITYNKLTLEQAAGIEALLQKAAHDACEFNAKVDGLVIDTTPQGSFIIDSPYYFDAPDPDPDNEIYFSPNLNVN
jgi:hypothetical protein